MRTVACRRLDKLKTCLPSHSNSTTVISRPLFATSSHYVQHITYKVLRYSKVNSIIIIVVLLLLYYCNRRKAQNITASLNETQTYLKMSVDMFDVCIALIQTLIYIPQKDGHKTYKIYFLSISYLLDRCAE